jgi:hypothetical protein
LAGKADGTVTVLEAYHGSVYELAQWMGRLKAPYTIVEQNGGKVAVPRGDWIVAGLSRSSANSTPAARTSLARRFSRRRASPRFRTGSFL